jgi:DNA-binding transcriptional MerR regulator
MLSHDELLEELRAQGIEVTAVTLEHWRRNGVIPRPIRRYHNGQTRPVYPAWLVPAIIHLRQLQDSGRTLAQIAPVMRAHAINSVQVRDPLADTLAELDAALRKLAEATQPDAASVTVTFHDEAGERLHYHHDLPLAR